MSAAIMAALAIEYSVTLRYGQDPDDATNKKPVLLIEEQFHNSSTTKTELLSFWNNEPFLRSIEPKGSVTKHKANGQPGKPAPPKAEHIVELAPGKTVTRTRWYWAESALPFNDDGGAHYYRVKAGTKLTLSLCRRFRNDAELFTMMLKKKFSPMSMAEVCSKPVTFDYVVKVNYD